MIAIYIYTVYMTNILISLPDTLIEKLDAYCKANEYNRSELIRHLLRLKMDWIDDRGYVKELAGVPSGSTDKSPKIIQKKEKVFKTKLVTVEPNKENTTLNLQSVAKSRGYWICPHGGPGRLCKKISCQQEARKHEK